MRFGARPRRQGDLEAGREPLDQGTQDVPPHRIAAVSGARWLARPLVTWKIPLAAGDRAM